MPRYLVQHHHEPHECGIAFAAFKGHESPLRHRRRSRPAPPAATRSGGWSTPRPSRTRLRSCRSSWPRARRRPASARSRSRDHRTSPEPEGDPDATVSPPLAGAGRTRAQPARHHDGQHDPQRRPADDPRGARRQLEPAAVDRGQLPAGVRRPPARRRQPRRSLRTQARAGVRVGRVRARVRLRGPLDRRDHADRFTRAHGPRRGRDHAHDAVDPDQHLPVQRAAEGDRRLGRGVGAGHRDRTDLRRLPDRALLLEQHLPDQPARRGRVPDRRDRARPEFA